MWQAAVETYIDDVVKLGKSLQYYVERVQVIFSLLINAAASHRHNNYKF